MKYLLLLFLAGQPQYPERTIVVNGGAAECMVKSMFEMRWDPKIETTYCLPLNRKGDIES